MTYEHFVYTPDTNALAGEYQRAGYVASTHDDGLVMIYSDDTELDRGVIRQIAESHGATYDGGGMYIG